MLYAVYVWYNPSQNANKNLLLKVNSARSSVDIRIAMPNGENHPIAAQKEQ